MTTEQDTQSVRGISPRTFTDSADLQRFLDLFPERRASAIPGRYRITGGCTLTVQPTTFHDRDPFTYYGWTVAWTVRT